MQSDVLASLAAMERNVDRELEEAQATKTAAWESDDDDGPVDMRAMEEEMGNTEIFAEVVRGHMATAARRSAALGRVLDTKRRLAEVTNAPKTERKKPKDEATNAPTERKKEAWADAPGEKLRIERRGVRQLPFVLEQGDVLRWQFCVRWESKVRFRVRRRAMGIGGATETDLSKAKSLSASQGEYTADTSSTILLVFDNSAALFRSVDVACAVDVIRATSTVQVSEYHREWLELHDLRDVQQPTIPTTLRCRRRRPS